MLVLNTGHGCCWLRKRGSVNEAGRNQAPHFSIDKLAVAERNQGPLESRADSGRCENRNRSGVKSSSALLALPSHIEPPSAQSGSLGALEMWPSVLLTGARDWAGFLTPYYKPE